MSWSFKLLKISSSSLLTWASTSSSSSSSLSSTLASLPHRIMPVVPPSLCCMVLQAFRISCEVKMEEGIGVVGGDDDDVVVVVVIVVCIGGGGGLPNTSVTSTSGPKGSNESSKRIPLSIAATASS